MSNETDKSAKFKWETIATKKINERELYLGQSLQIGTKKYKDTFERGDWWYNENEPVKKRLKDVKKEENEILEGLLNNDREIISNKIESSEEPSNISSVRNSSPKEIGELSSVDGNSDSEIEAFIDDKPENITSAKQKINQIISKKITFKPLKSLKKNVI